jgi:hypothetical protein
MKILETIDNRITANRAKLQKMLADLHNDSSTNTRWPAEPLVELVRKIIRDIKQKRGIQSLLPCLHDKPQKIRRKRRAIELPHAKPSIQPFAATDASTGIQNASEPDDGGECEDDLW